MLDSIIKNCQILLHEYHGASAAKNYLDQRISESSQQLFEFGYFPPSPQLPVLLSSIDENILIEQKLLYSRNINDSQGPHKIITSYFENWSLIFPFKDAYGNIVGIVGRTLLSEEDRVKDNIVKYKNTHFNKGNFLFGLHLAKKSILQKDSVVVVEGQFDAIKAYEKGITNVVALGTSTMTNYQFSVITRYTRNLIIILDDDDAGKKGRQSMDQRFSKLAQLKHVYIPQPHKDLYDLLSDPKYSSPSCIPQDILL